MTRHVTERKITVVRNLSKMRRRSNRPEPLTTKLDRLVQKRRQVTTNQRCLTPENSEVLRAKK